MYSFAEEVKISEPVVTNEDEILLSLPPKSEKSKFVPRKSSDCDTYADYEG